MESTNRKTFFSAACRELSAVINTSDLQATSTNLQTDARNSLKGSNQVYSSLGQQFLVMTYDILDDGDATITEFTAKISGVTQINILFYTEPDTTQTVCYS